MSSPPGHGVLNLDGGSGTDTLSLDFSGDADKVTFDLHTGAITIGGQSSGTAANFEQVAITTGDGGSKVTSGDLDDTFRPGAGADTIYGGGRRRFRLRLGRQRRHPSRRRR